MIFFFRCRRVRALRCAQWCAWLRRMPARPIRSCISHLRTAPSFRCVRVVLGGVYSRDAHLSLCVTLSRCDTQTLPPSLPPSLHLSLILPFNIQVCVHAGHIRTRTHAYTHTHTHHHQTNTLRPGRWCQRKHPSSISRHLTSRCPS